MKKILLLSRSDKDKRAQVFVADLAGGKIRQVSQGSQAARTCTGACWSPDGQQIAYAWCPLIENPTATEEGEFFLTLTDVEGRRPVTFSMGKTSDRSTPDHLRWLEWR